MILNCSLGLRATTTTTTISSSSSGYEDHSNISKWFSEVHLGILSWYELYGSNDPPIRSFGSLWLPGSLYGILYDFRTVKKTDEVAHWAAFIHERILSIRMTKDAQPKSYKHQRQSPCERGEARQGQTGKQGETLVFFHREFFWTPLWVVFDISAP